MRKKTIIIIICTILLFYGVGGILNESEKTEAQKLKPIDIEAESEVRSTPGSVIVDWNGQGDYETIQDAIEYANDGDIIHIKSGTYYEHIEIDKKIILIGESKEDCIIDGTHEGKVIRVISNDVTIKNLTIINSGKSEGSGGDLGYEYDAAIEILANGLIVSDCNFRNISKVPLLFYGSGSDSIIVNNQFFGDYMNAVRLYGYYLHSIKFLNNSFYYSYGIVGYNPRNMENILIKGNSFYGANWNGITFNLLNPYQWIKKLIIINNVFDGKKNAIFIQRAFDSIICYNTFQNCTENAIDINKSNNVTIHHNNFIDNGYETQVKDNGEINYWNNSEERGNYWSDYSKKYPNASNNSVIWETPYEIDDDDGDTYDFYPLVNKVKINPINIKPVAVIDNITPAQAKSGQEILFLGNGTDEDGYITSYRWVSNIDGVLSYEQAFNTNALNIGTHSITFSVQDNEGLWSDSDLRILNITKPEYNNDNISIVLDLTKSEFFINESITGIINISNNNPFDIWLNDQGFQNYRSCDIDVQSIETNSKFGAVPNISTTPSLEVKSNSHLTLDFKLDEFVVLPIDTKELKYTKLEPGNYSIYTYFYYGEQKNYNILDSNIEFFKIINKEISGIENITISLELSKSEFFKGEPINGSILISNDNLFDITFVYPPVSVNEHFVIDSIDNSSSFLGYSNNRLYPIELKAKHLTSVNFAINDYLKLPIKTKENRKIQLAGGNYSIHIFIYYGNYFDYCLIESNHVPFRIVENSSNSGNINNVPKPHPSDGHNGFSHQLITNLIIGVSIISVVILITFITATEVGKYGFYSTFLPLYTKTRKKKIDKKYGYLKGLILGYILGNPGENYNAIKRELELKNGTLSYYLMVLEREERIKSERDGMYKRFYPARGKIIQDILELTNSQRDIYRTIKENLGISQKEIAVLLGIAQSTVSYHLDIMRKARLVRVEYEGKGTKCYIIDETS